MRAQEGDGGLQHLQAGLAAGEPVILVLQGDQLDVLLFAPQGVEHDAALLEGHDRIVAPMDQEHGHIHGSQMFNRRNRVEERITRAADAHEAVQ